jgi:hypothetical protein
MSVADIVDRTPDAQREFFRYMKGSERLTLQGFPVKVLRNLPPEVVVKATGNAYPVPLIAAVMHPALEVLGSSSFNLAKWPPAGMLSRKVPDSVGKAIAAFRRYKPQKQTLKRKAPAFRSTAQKKARRR